MNTKLTKLLILLGLFLSFNSGFSQNGKILIIQDETPQLKPLITFLENEGKFSVEMVDQANLPKNFSDYKATIGYIHGKLEVEAEKAIIDYTENGGKFICLHHSISSGKANNEFYFDFLGIQLDHPEFSKYPVNPGEGYGWFHDGEKGVPLTLVNLNPNHYIINHKIEWGKSISYSSSDGPSAEGTFPSITLNATEVYMNHKFTDGREKTVLCGFKYYDFRNGKIFMQDRAVWYKDYKKGQIFYFMPGDRITDYQNKNISQMILNAINFD
ncbi:ThuA domain-containing protein [Flexithrix dorotheae]|uniref:ThuA domain-containing protein n=1 Tax=Flexithrix dorotheae TaxID=70993 RepID=UPI00035DDFB2|nr:ThuA domain-containing protein [Flexithrix dorotheae]